MRPNLTSSRRAEPPISSKRRWPAAAVRPIADELVAALEPRCERVCVAGSLRRGKAEVGDIEILYVPRIGQVRPPGEFFSKPGSLADELIEQRLARGVLRKRPNIKGVTSWGSENKLAVHVASGVPVDLFATTAERWFMSLVIRTGSKDMNVTLAATAQKRGMRLEAYGVLVGAGGEKIVPQSEHEVFERLGAPYREPEKR